ncbi:MAG: hypothetical protein COB77_04250 [Gammaproteobacteria bacterium]|nr:MAG: hypothetical protein COB77_04250 [Gammaproteobacteria bacterium]
MSNPTQFKWTGATEREDGSAYLPTDRKGYNASLRPADEAAELPDNYIVFSPISQTQDFVFPVADLANPPSEGDWLITVQEVDNEGRVSVWTEDVAFTWVTASPKSPTGLSVL